MAAEVGVISDIIIRKGVLGQLTCLDLSKDGRKLEDVSKQARSRLGSVLRMDGVVVEMGGRETHEEAGTMAQAKGHDDREG
jgi:hypothetical protein